MNRRLIAGIVIIIAACVGLYFWAESEKARFDEERSVLPAEQVSDDTAGGHWHGDEWHAEEAPPVQPVTPPPAATDDTEAARRLNEALLRLTQPDDLDLEREAIKADLDALIEQQGTLSPAKLQKGLRDIERRQQALHEKWNERLKEYDAIREREAKKAEENNQ